MGSMWIVDSNQATQQSYEFPNQKMTLLQCTAKFNFVTKEERSKRSTE